LNTEYYFEPCSAAFEFSLRTRIVFGEGTLNRLSAEIKQLGGDNVVIITSQGMAGRQALKDSVSSLIKGGISFRVYSSAPPDPSIRDLDSCLKFLQQVKPGVVVGLGGGSAMDVAKKVAAELTVPKIMVPTTAGSGSEVTRNSVFKVDGHKKSYSDLKIAADVAIVDPDLLQTMPAATMVSSAMDAMAHAVESYGSRKGNGIVRAIALEAYLLIKNYVSAALEGTADGRRNVALGSLMAGMSIANTGTTLGHALANPLSSLGVPHGRALALVLPYLLKINRFDAGYAAELELFRRKNCAVPQIAWDIPGMAAEVAADERHLAANPVKVTLQQVIDIYSGIREESMDARP
jgi:alcohol dehydrogenase class IV